MNKFKIIADSGSTKTDWVIVDEKGQTVDRVHSIGFNPYFHSSEFIYNEVLKAFDLIKISMDNIDEVFFYGSGCSSNEKKTLVHNALQLHFANAKIDVNHDLTGAALAALGNNNGIACIIGTGSNSCVWENRVIIDNIPSHGYIFGDEGSGSYLGIELLKLYLNDKIEGSLKTDFERTFKLSKDQILNTTYREKDPNVFLAHFASFYASKLNHDFLRAIVHKGFDDFFKVRILPYKNYQKYNLGFVGSIAFHYQDILKEVAQQYKMKIGKISKCPIDELVKHHSNIGSMKVA